MRFFSFVFDLLNSFKPHAQHLHTTTLLSPEISQQIPAICVTVQDTRGIARLSLLLSYSD